MDVRWTTVEVFATRSMAEVAGTALRSAGLPVRVIADDAQGVGLPLGLRFNGAELQVRPDDVDEARDLLGGEVVTDPDDVGLQAAGGDEQPAPQALVLEAPSALPAVAALLAVVLLLTALWTALG